MVAEIPITISDEIARPCDVPKRGERRLVRLLPTPFGSRPAIWTSPYKVPTILQEGQPAEPCRVCILLMSAGSPEARPDVICVTIPDAVIAKFPLVPVEW
jgi:hypothetical protein